MAYTYLTSYSVPGKNIYGKDLTNYVFTIDLYTEASDPASNYTRVKFVPSIHYTAGVTSTSSTYYFKTNGSNTEYLYLKLGVTTNDHYFSDYYQTYYHNSDGSKQISIRFDCETEISESMNANLNNYCFKSATISIENLALPTINRISPFSFTDGFTMGSSRTITISPYVSSFRHTVSYAFGSASGTIGSNISTSVSWTPSKDLGYQIPNSLNGVGSITVTTYNGSTKIGSISKTFTLWVSGDMNPTFDIGYTGNDLFSNVYITKYSSITLNINNATGSYGSTIKSYSITGEGVSSSESSATTAVFTSSGNKTYTLKVTDSRGRTTTKTKSLNVFWYDSPKIEWTMLSRANDNKEPFDKGNYLFAQLNYEIANPSNSNTNQRNYSLEYKETSSASWTTLLSGALSFYAVDDYECNTTQVFELSKSYDIRFTITDSLESTSITGVLPVATCIMDIEKTGVGIGKYWEQGALDVSGDFYLNSVKFCESGTFNPAFYVSDGCSGVYTRRGGYYQKVGEWCTCNIALVVENFFNGSTPSNQFKIINLPFYNKGTYCAVTIGYLEGIVHTTTNTITKAYIRPNESDVVFVCTCETTGKVNSVSGSNIPGARIDIQVSFTYKVE